MYVCKAKGSSVCIDKAKKKDCLRTIICDNHALPLSAQANHKFCEIVDFVGSTNTDYALCIGLNPKWGRENQFDRSNQKLAGYLKQNYKGFILFNMFSILTDSKQQLKQYIKNNTSDVINDMRDVIAFVVSATQNDIVLFYGDDAYSYVQSTRLSAAMSTAHTNNRTIYISWDNSNAKFVHVGSQKCGTRMFANIVQYASQANVF